MSDLTSPQNLSDDKLKLALYNSIRFLDDVTNMETELSVIYDEATTIVQTAINTLHGIVRPDDDSNQKDIARP